MSTYKCKKVFQLGANLNLAGTERVFMNWLQHIDHSLLQCDFGFQRINYEPFAKQIQEFGGKIYLLPHTRLSRKWKLYQILKREKYDVFQTHGHWFAGLDCFIAQLANVPKRVTISHFAKGKGAVSIFETFKQLLARLLIRLFSTDRLAVSQEAGETLYGKHLSFITIHNGIDLQKFTYSPVIRAQKRKELNLEDKFVVGHVGRFAKQKNHTFLIDVFAEIYKKNMSARLVLLGVGNLETEIRKKVKDFGLTDVVLFVGSCTNVQDYYQAFDVFVFPSLFEGLGIVAIEAQCSGLPCIMSDVIPKEAFVCNATAISLQRSPTEWAEIILKKATTFERKDESSVIKAAGFDTVEVGKFIQQEYLE